MHLLPLKSHLTWKQGHFELRAYIVPCHNDQRRRAFAYDASIRRTGNIHAYARKFRTCPRIKLNIFGLLE